MNMRRIFSAGIWRRTACPEFIGAVFTGLHPSADVAVTPRPSCFIAMPGIYTCLIAMIDIDDHACGWCAIGFVYYAIDGNAAAVLVPVGEIRSIMQLIKRSWAFIDGFATFAAAAHIAIDSFVLTAAVKNDGEREA